MRWVATCCLGGRGWETSRNDAVRLRFCPVAPTLSRRDSTRLFLLTGLTLLLFTRRGVDLRRERSGCFSGFLLRLSLRLLRLRSSRASFSALSFSVFALRYSDTSVFGLPDNLGFGFDAAWSPLGFAFLLFDLSTVPEEA